MDIPNSKRGAHSRDPERARLLRENSYLSSSEVNYYGSTPTSLKIPNVNSISDLMEVEKAFHNYSLNHDELGNEIPGGWGRRLSHQLSQSLSTKRPAKKSQLEASTSIGNAMFRMDSEALDASTSLEVGQLSNSIKTNTTRRMNDFISSGSIRLPSHGDTNSLYHYMREHRKSQKAQIYESLDYEVNENVLYLMEKKRSLRAKQNNSIFCKYIRSYFPSQKEASRWLTFFLIGAFTALTACFIVVNVDYFTEKKYEYLHNLFEKYLDKNQVMATNQTDPNLTVSSLNLTNSTTTLLGLDSSSFQTLNFDKSVLGMRLIKLQIPMLFWFVANAIPTLLGSALVTYLGE